jgi:hypothetical protein
MYKGKACEIVGDKEIFGHRIAWIRLMEDEGFHDVEPVLPTPTANAKCFSAPKVFWSTYAFQWFSRMNSISV